MEQEIQDALISDEVIVSIVDKLPAWFIITGVGIVLLVAIVGYLSGKNIALLPQITTLLLGKKSSAQVVDGIMLQPIKQTDIWFENNNREIAFFGCLFMALIMTNVKWRTATAQEINALFKKCKKELVIATDGVNVGLPALGDKCLVNNINAILRIAGSKERHSFRHNNGESMTTFDGYTSMVVRWRVNNSGTHFVLVSKGLSYDPYGDTNLYDMTYNEINRMDYLK